MKIKNQNSFYYLIPILSFFLLGSLSCIGTHSSVSNNTSSDSATKTPQIIFLNYSIKLDKSKGDYEIRLINKIITEGKLKISNSEPEIPKPGDLLCIALNNNLEPIDSIVIADPLNISVESTDENNAFFRKEITLDSAQFSIRMQLNKKTDAIAIKKNTNSENQNSYLIMTKIR